VNDFNLKVMARYTGLDGIHGGFSDHSSAGHIIPVVAACALGADMVERHIKLPTTHVEKDTVADTLGFSNTFSQYCEAIKYTELALGTSVKTVLKSENHKYST
jgi:sialic acid synthase SpsE